jgi:salicylate hydroxylase
MAVEDGAVLGKLLGLLQQHLTESKLNKRDQVASILKLFEQRRKQRTEVNVSGAVEKREFYHLPDGERQIERDRLLADLFQVDFKTQCKWSWGDQSYNDGLLGFDVLRDAEDSFTKWAKKEKL